MTNEICSQSSPHFIRMQRSNASEQIPSYYVQRIDPHLIQFRSISMTGCRAGTNKEPLTLKQAFGFID